MRGRKDSITTNNPQSKQKYWEHILGLIQQLFDLRLVQHLAMPIEKQKKQALLFKFRQKMNLLHYSLKQAQNQGIKGYQTGSTRDKSHSKAAMQSRYMQRKKDRVKIVQMMYTQLFFEGSFRHYHKVALMMGLPINIEPIDIQEWARNCELQQFEQQKCCCDQDGCCCKSDKCCCCYKE